MQAGMLFQAILGQSSIAGGYDVEQMHIMLDEEIDASVLGQAFTRVAERHPILSTSFLWEQGEPQQQVESGFTVPLDVRDWRGLGEDERNRRRQEFMVRDRARGFYMRVAPLMRVTVFRCDGGRTEAVWTFHHILLDGRSFAPVLQEVFSTYHAISTSKIWTPPPLPRPYRDFVGWVAARDESRSLAYFRKLLAGKTSDTPLPGAEPAARPLPRDGYGEIVRTVDPEIVARVHALAARTGTTPGTVLQAAVALVLSRYTGDADVLFGNIRACRHSALGGDAERMIGLFINTLPVRAGTGDDLTVLELLADLRTQSIAMRDHEHTSLVAIQGESEIPRGTPLFETLFMFDTREINQILRADGDPRWLKRWFTLREQPAVPLAITVFDAERLEVRMLFDRRRFRDVVVERLIASLAVTMDGLSQDENRPLGQVEVLPVEERRKIVVDWNDTARPFPEGLKIHELFERRAVEQPNAIAVDMDGRTLSYRELDERANQLAHALRGRGAGPGRYVGICLDRGPELVVAMLGAAKSGSPYIPLDPRYPTERLAFMVEDSAAFLVVTEERHKRLFPTPVLVVAGEHDSDAAQIARQPATRPVPRGDATAACYAIFTSGSTGTPKGVVLSHRAVVNTLDWVSRTFGVGPRDRILFVTSPCFDLSVYDTFGALGAGATVVVASDALLADPEALARAITEQRITIWDSAPAALQRLVPFLPAPAPAAGSPTSGGLYDPQEPAKKPRAEEASPLRLVMLSGDWIPLALPDVVRAAFPGAEVMSLGGATEAAIWSNHFSIGAVDPRWPSIPYGRPIQNARYHVLDAGMRPSAVGVSGDLYIGGACLADGYLNRPALTAERFIPDPLSTVAGERLYKTGDLARYMENGNLEFLGRADFQVKIRGFRVEMGEVEAVIAGLPGVRETVCAAQADAAGQKSLIAYVVPTHSADSGGADGRSNGTTGGAALDPRAIREAVAHKLPDFMTPSQVIVLDALPISANGKVDRKALPRPTARPTHGDFVPPRTDAEWAMAAIWSELLQREPIGATDDFFALGGHSLLAVMLLSQVKSRFGVDLPLITVLEQPTLEAMARAVSAPRQVPKGPHDLVALNRGGERPPIVLVAGVGGYAFTYQSLAGLLGADQPVYALQSTGAERDAALVDYSVEEMAEIYEAEILEAFPTGPIVLGGFSFGMLPAFELAHRLHQRGRRVPLLISFDGFAPGYPQRLPGVQRLSAHAKQLLLGKDRVKYLKDRLSNLQTRILHMLGRDYQAAPDLPLLDQELNDHLRKLWIIHCNARQRYLPRHVEPSALLLIRSAIAMHWPATKMDCPIHGWYPFVSGPISVVTIPGEHLSLFAPQNLPLMAEVITDHVAPCATRLDV
jgi:amino acid adenylation domain-containing protein